MGILEIFLIIVGIVIIITSFVISDKNNNSNAEENDIDQKELMSFFLKEEEKRLKENIEKTFEEKTEDIIIKTEDALNSISNKKIMEMSEFSEQVLLKIEENHKEIVFLYSMLNEKESEIKKLMQERPVERKNRIKETEPQKRVEDKKAVKREQVHHKPNQQAAIVREKVRQMAASTEKEDIIGDNNNYSILELYKQGKSIVEIAKLLNQGRGEVQLVIDLFQGSRK